MSMIQHMITYSIVFLMDLAEWLVTPVPLIFVTLFILVYVFQLVRRLLNA